MRPDVHDLAGQLRLEYCVGIRGKVVSRRERTRGLEDGQIEVHATGTEIFNRSGADANLRIEDKLDTSEEKRLQYRYLDLRRAPLQKTLMIRAREPHHAQPLHRPGLPRASRPCSW